MGGVHEQMSVCGSKMIVCLKGRCCMIAALNATLLHLRSSPAARLVPAFAAGMAPVSPMYAPGAGDFVIIEGPDTVHDGWRAPAAFQPFAEMFVWQIHPNNKSGTPSPPTSFTPASRRTRARAPSSRRSTPIRPTSMPAPASIRASTTGARTIRRAGLSNAASPTSKTAPRASLSPPAWRPSPACSNWSTSRRSPPFARRAASSR